MVTAIIPTLNEEKRIGEIIAYLQSKPVVTEIIIIDDGSTDTTLSIAKSAGAKAYLSSMLGKGTSMADGLNRAQNDIVLYLDGDIYGFDQNLVETMTSPLLANRADFVKGRFHRQAGRVTALTAKPLLKLFFPDLVEIEQPLGGIVAARKSFLDKVKFELDYGVDIGLLIDIHHIGARIVEADIGSIEHDHQSLDALSKMSFQITRTILEKASKYKKLSIAHVRDSSEVDRKSGIQLGSLISKIKKDKNLILFDMDGTLVEGSFIHSLAKYTGKTEELSGLLGNHNLDARYRAKMIAKVLAGIPKSTFEKVAATIPLKPYAQRTIVELKKLGFQVGIITDSYLVAAETVRRRIFADFSIAHFLLFRNNLATGDIILSPFMEFEDGCEEHALCKSNFIRHLKILLPDQIPHIMAVGNGENDTCLFKSVNDSFAIYPQSLTVIRSAKNVILTLDEIIEYSRAKNKTGS